jgi:hypothetical protein
MDEFLEPFPSFPHHQLCGQVEGTSVFGGEEEPIGGPEGTSTREVGESKAMEQENFSLHAAFPTGSGR